MKYTLLIIVLTFIFCSCTDKNEISSINPQKWSQRVATIASADSLEYGKSYLSIYSQIYSRTERLTQNLTSMASIRNTSDLDTIYILRAEYYDTYGKSVRTYFQKPIYLAPLETIEIIIDEVDTTGGTGSNFIFEWKKPLNTPEPLFEGVMTSHVGQQGLSFTTQAKRIQ